MKKAQLILMRHGESIYNQKNLFTGWTDVDLSRKGIEEAKESAKLLKNAGILPDICFTSWLKRAIHTAQIVLNEIEWEHINVLKSYKLNERHYGAWQGRNKSEILKEYGEEKFMAIRRGYDTPPPPLNLNDPRVPWNDKKYQNIELDTLPLCESLKDTRKRVVEYYNDAIIPYLKKSKKVFISAHGNSLRALVMYLENIPKEEIGKLEIPTGEVIIYEFDNNLEILNKNIVKS